MKRIQIVVMLTLAWQFGIAQGLEVKHGFVNNGDIKIHFVEKGEGPLIVMLHGFPDFWYSWYPIMNQLAADYKVVAMDLRGYNQSSAPDDVASYAFKHLLTDVTKVIQYQGEENAIIIGHDWGAALGWRLTMFHPEYVNLLVALNIPHLKGTNRALAKSTKEAGTNYTSRFFQEGFEKQVTLGWFTNWGIDSTLRPHYASAYERSNVKAMLNYYKANVSRPEDLAKGEGSTSSSIDVDKPVLIIHAVDDPFISVNGLNDNWLFNKKSTSIHVLPEGGHFFHHKKPELISQLISDWLNIQQLFAEE